MERIIANYNEQFDGPTVIFVAAMHGNEGSGVIALQQVAQHLEKHKSRLKGNVLAMIGNMPAYAKGVRYVSEDLNRIWGKEDAEKIETGEWTELNTNDERKEQVILYKLVKNILQSGKGPFIFADLHTVSSKTEPFITINDMLRNRRLAAQFPVPIILGMEEYIKGSFLSRVNSLGHAAIGFEAGRHADNETIKNQASFIRLMIHFNNVFKYEDYLVAKDLRQLECELSHRFFEIRYHHKLATHDLFKMLPDFRNFSRIKRQESLGKMNGNGISSPFRGRLFMPLYQKQGSDAFFIVRRIFLMALWFSAKLRSINWTPFLLILPGVKRHAEVPKWICVNRTKARFFTISLFHLLGYRCREQGEKWLYFVKREIIPQNF